MTARSASAAPEIAPPADALDELGSALRRLLGAERRLRGREHAPGELTHAQIRSLHALSEQGEMTAGELARSADLNPASVTAMLDHLEAAGIVARVRSTSDRRVTNVVLTPDGRELVAAKTAQWRARWAQRLASFDDSELQVAARVLEEVAGLFDSVAREKEHAAAQR